MTRRAGRGLLLSCLLLLASCTFPGSVPETVKIGLSAPFEGLYRDLGYEALYAVRLAVRQANEAGGIGGGFLVELVALNDLNDPPEAGRQAAEMAVDPGILGVIGGLSPRTAAAAAPHYAARGLAFVSPFPDPAALGQAAGRLAADPLGARTAALFYGDDPADLRQAEGFSAAFAAAGGTLLFRAQPDGGAAAAQQLAGLAAQPDALFLAADTSRAAAWIAALRGAGYGGTLLGGPEVGSRLTPALAGQAAEGVHCATPFPALVDDSAFVSAYTALSGGVAPRGVAAWSYAAARDLLAALDAALRSGAQPAREAVRESLAGRPLAAWPVQLTQFRGGELVAVSGPD